MTHARRALLPLALGLLALAVSMDRVEARTARPLAERVLVRRDTFGVPHVLAEDEEAAAFGLAFAMAEDHAPEMGRRYLGARGEAARVFGETEMEDDFLALRVDARGRARRALATMGGGFRRWMRGFAKGYNHFVTTRRAQLPDWMPLVEPDDVIAYANLGGIGSALRPPKALLEKYPGPSTASPAESDDTGSNAFALAGSRTTTGRPILVGNPHLRWSTLYWEAQVTVPGRLDFYGSTLVGLPVLRAGFNDRLGYVQTNNAPDLEDVYALALDPRHPGSYLFEGRARPIRARAVTVEVKGADGTVEPVVRTFEETDLGPVVHRTADRVFAVRSMALEWWRHFEGFYRLMHARTLRDYRRVMDEGLFLTSNFTYADADGNIFYLWNARLPRRPTPADYSLDVPGERRFSWRGVHRVRELPQRLNPPHGAIQNANNPPWFVSLADPIDPAPYPPYVERGPLGLRPQVILEALGGERRFSPEDARDAKFTTRMLMADRLLPDLLAAARTVARPSPDLASAVEVLSAWDRHLAAPSVGAVLFETFVKLLIETRPDPFAQPWDPARPGLTPTGLADPASALPLLEKAVADTRARHGSERVAWGDVHRFRLGEHDLPADGGPGPYGVYRVVRFEPAPDGREVAGRIAGKDGLAGNGDAWVLVVDFSSPLRAWSVLAYGQAGDPASPHGQDQIVPFAQHRLRPVWFRPEEVSEHLEREYRP